MITIIGNNFEGACTGQTLKSVETPYYAVVNGCLDIDALSAGYLAADTLELKVEGLALASSAPVSVYATCKVAGQPYITIVKAWIKEAGTICVEKVAGWATVSSYRLTFQCIFFPLGYEFLPRSMSKTAITVSCSDGTANKFVDGCYVTDEWMTFFIEFSRLTVNDPTLPLNLDITGLSARAAGNLFLVYNDPSLESMGSGYHNMIVSPTGLQSEDVFGTLANEATARKFIKGTIISLPWPSRNSLNFRAVSPSPASLQELLSQRCACSGLSPREKSPTVPSAS